MKKYLIPLIFFFLSINILNSQTLIGGTPSFPPSDFNSKDLDTSKQNFFYEYTYVRNPDEKLKKRTALTVLQIGTNFSKFSDYNSLKLDSVQEKQSNLKRIEKNEITQQLNYRTKIGFKITAVKDLSSNKFSIQSKIPSNNYQYEIDQPKLNWKLEEEYRTILDFNVQKATVFYSGRSWIAWFAISIPISSGPYTFNNLPGLILELYDDQKNFHFILNGINNEIKNIYIRNEDNIIKTSRSKFLNTEKSYHERPDLFLKGSEENLKELKKIPYNPIDLKY